MYKTGEQFGLTQDQINKIADNLWKKELKSKKEVCGDCGAKIGEKHKDGCDIARCTNCGKQRLSCNCQNGDSDVWTGIYPGIKECYDEKLICTYNDGKDWILDLNSYYSKHPE